jgi:integrative and conjugative element protein (TIGR02256 family)
MSRIFFYPGQARYVLFTDHVLQHMYFHAQRRFWQKEAGGELFSADPRSDGLIISNAKGPNSSDARRRNAWSPDIKASDTDRLNEYAQNRHAVGLWHTHPESDPWPSGRDQETTWEYLDALASDRARYLMVIVGNHGIVPAVVVWVAHYESKRCWIQLSETIADDQTGKRQDLPTCLVRP